MQPATVMASSSTSNDPYREKVLGLRHKIFLSYSGADQDFLWELYEDLREHDYDPFFDQKSLPKATPVSMGNIVPEVAHSDLAVFFTSEAFFTRNKNPMMELVECVKNKVRLLPLFYKITVDKIKESLESWYNNEWSKWGVDQDEFQKALKTLLHMSGIENKEGLRGRQFRRRVVQEIQNIFPPHILPDVSDLCGGDRLVKVVKAMYEEHLPQHKTTQAPSVLLGLYGTSGSGKSTLCKLLQNSECPVCYIQLDSLMDETAQLERMKKVLQSLTILSKDLINKLSKPDEAKRKLFEWEYEKKVFFIIDNVIPESLEEAMIYLRGGCRRFKPGSKVLITGHTKAVLHGLAKETDLEWHIAAMPDLKKEEATQILVKRAGCPVQEHLAERCLELCRFQKGRGKGDHYHPLVLNALAQSLAHNDLYSNQEEMTEWVASLESSFCYTDTDVKGKVLQHLLRSTSYNLLTGLQKQVFLDIAFYLPFRIYGVQDKICEWLDMVHGKKTKEAVRILMRRGLIDLSALRAGKKSFRGGLMHDLYYEMATLIVQEKGSECFFSCYGSEKELPLNCQNIKRFFRGNCYPRRGIVLHKFSSLQVLSIVTFLGVRELNLEGAVCLRSVSYLACSKQGPEELQILGLDHCHSLVYLTAMSGAFNCYSNRPKKDRVFLRPNLSEKGNGFHLPKLRYLNLCLTGIDFNMPFDIISCSRLENLILSVDNGHPFEHPDLRGLTNLRVFDYSCKHGLRRQDCTEDVVFQFGQEIESIRIIGCIHLSGLKILNDKCHLRKLVLEDCPKVKAVEGLDQVNLLKKLHLFSSGLTTWPKLPNQIEDFKIERCKSIPAEDTIAVLRTLGLSAQFYLASISLLMERSRDYAYPERINSASICGVRCNGLQPGIWQNILPVIVESKEALDTISRLLQVHFGHIDLLRFVLFLCFGGRYKKMGELLRKPHVVKAFVEAKQPFCLLLLAIANDYFGADLESHASTIATMVCYSVTKHKWFRFQECAASIAATNASVAKELPTIVLDRLKL